MKRTEEQKARRATEHAKRVEAEAQRRQAGLDHEQTVALQIAELKRKLEYDSDPQRGLEFVAACLRWIDSAEQATAGDLATLTRISAEISASLGNGDAIRDRLGRGILQLDSWDGVRWRSAADIRKISVAEIERRGLAEEWAAAEAMHRQRTQVQGETIQ
jgi:hypothetical protein